VKKKVYGDRYFQAYTWKIFSRRLEAGSTVGTASSRPKLFWIAIPTEVNAGSPQCAVTCWEKLEKGGEFH